MRSALVCCLVVAVWAAQSALAAQPDFQMLDALPLDDPATRQLLDIERTGDRLVAVGERGLIIVSPDNGKTWQQAPVPVSLTLTAVTFADERNGWAVGHGGIILHTGDGGSSWQQQFSGNDANRQWLEYARREKAAIEQQLATLSEDAEARSELEYQLEDAAYTVEEAERAVATGPVDPFLDIWFEDADTGFAVGAYGMIYRTDNGGREWELRADTIENPYRYHYYDLLQGSEGRLFISGEAGLLYRSLDGGESWERIEGVYDGSLFGLAATDGAVLTYGLRGFVFRSDDGGETWTALTEGDSPSFYGGTTLPDGDIILVGGGGTVAVSRDGGDNFEYRTHPSRSTFADAISDGEGGAHVVGMSGLKALDSLGNTR